MTESVRNEVNKLAKEISGVIPTKSIYIFGSFAYGNPNNDSDLDLCILTKDSSMRKRDLIKRIRKSITSISTMPVDILVYNEDEFLERAVLESTIEYKIAHEGVNVYEQ